MKLWLGENKPSEDWTGCTKMEGLLLVLWIDSNIEEVAVGTGFSEEDGGIEAALELVKVTTTNKDMEVEHH